MEYHLDLNSTRAKNSRYASKYANKTAVIVYKVLIVLLLLTGVSLLIWQKSPYGWIIMIPATWTIMFYAWSQGSLGDKSYGQRQDQVDDMLEQATLAQLKTDQPSCYDIWKSLEKSEERYFIGNRYLIDESYFENLLSREVGSANKLWGVCKNYQTKYNLSGFSNMAILVALVTSVPNYDQLLKSVKLELAEVETAIPWMRDVLEKRRLVKESKSFGGIGRDWAFGYAPILRALGYNVSHDIEMHGFFSDTKMHEKIVEQMIQMLSSGNGTATLVGETGVGKTTCVHAFAEYILGQPKNSSSVAHHQVIQLDTPTLLANAKNSGQLEELMLKILNEAHKAKNIILFFDDAEVFFGYGSSIDLTHVLQPAIEAHSLKLILAMSPFAWQKITSEGKGGRLQPLNVAPADEENSLAVLRDSISLAEYRNKSVFTYTALKEAYRLGLRYVDNQAMPGAALTILEQAATTAQNQLITSEVVQASVESTYDIKLQASSSSESQKLLDLETELHKQVLSQDRAISVVANALRRARSGVGNPNRPVGTFLFLGPTGVGKTELSKALARTYFSNESSLIRVDMNQYVEQSDVSRLIQPINSQDLSFLGQVRKKPFSVILLDEIEKAHSSVINALLQMLDEGIMKDGEGRDVSFRDAIVIATSNAGADEIRQMISEGQDIDNAESIFSESLMKRGIFAPEFINRFDEIVIFKPLSQTDLVKVVDLIVADINSNLHSQKVQVELSQNAKEWLVEKGYDSKLGARPMRRMVQRYVENTVAKKLLDGSFQPGQTIKLDTVDIIS